YCSAPEDFHKLPSDDLWVRCPHCQELLYLKEHEQALQVCSKCKYHFPLTAGERVGITVDEGSFQELDPGIRSGDPLKFSSPGSVYADKLEEYQTRTDVDEAFVYGTARLDGQPFMIGATEFKFCGGAMGAAVGEKIARTFDLAREQGLPVVIFAGGGGARMQEGMVSLMQMAKTVAALDRFKDSRLPFISVMTDPCLGGTTASFAMLGDVNIAEPGAYIGFAGRRVIEQTMRQKLPREAATAEFLQEHGMVDMVVARGELRTVLARLLGLYAASRQPVQTPERQLVGQPA
ncbi:MAG: acetyl-CoA carboxylase, carboxyltransferase subunit beta, partial [Chloroflexota bacterium]